MKLTSTEDLQELANFVLENQKIATFRLTKKIIKKHLLTIHPELRDVIYKKTIDGPLDAWILKQKLIFGDKLLVTRLNEPLDYLSR